jgi:N-methylhydantoinase B
MVSYSCGGGGYGPPHERSIERVVHDVNEGWVSRERAASIYGVAIDGNGIDAARTAELRRPRAPSNIPA